MNLRKTFEGDFKKMELTWEMAKRAKQKKEFHGEKGVAALSEMDRSKQRRRIKFKDFILETQHFAHCTYLY